MDGFVPPQVVLLHDLIDQARPGDEIEVTGIYTNNFDAVLNMKNGFPVFSTSLEANSINKRDDKFNASKLSDKDREEILRLAADENIGRRIIKSIAPSIYGHRNVKTALALSMFSGVGKTVAGKPRRLLGPVFLFPPTPLLPPLFVSQRQAKECGRFRRQAQSARRHQRPSFGRPWACQVAVSKVY